MLSKRIKNKWYGFANQINIYYKIAKKSTDMLELKNKYQEDEISKQEYNAEKKRYLSEKVIKNNKFFPKIKTFFISLILYLKQFLLFLVNS